MARSRTRLVVGVAVVASTAALTLSVPAAHAGPVVQPVADGFAGPLGLTVANGGRIYVAEAFAGKITALHEGGARSVAARPDGDVAGVDATVRGSLTYTVTGFPENEEEPPDTFVYRKTRSGDHRLLASPSEYEAANNPDGDQTYGFIGLSDRCAEKVPPFVLPYQGIIESNPYSVAILRDGSRLVGDAAGNSILRIGPRGKVSTVAVLPPVVQGPVDAAAAEQFGLPRCVIGHRYAGEPVPTDVEVGPDGHYYVTSLPGAPELPGYGSVWKINSHTGKLTRIASGFDGAVDLAVAENGTIYVAELFGSQISKVSPRGNVSVLTNVRTPGAIEIANDGTIYATTNVFKPDFSPGNGRVVKIGG